MHVRNLKYTIPYKSGVQEPPFSTTSQLNGIFGKKHDIHRPNQTSALDTTMGLLHRLKMSSTNDFKLDRHFIHPP